MLERELKDALGSLTKHVFYCGSPTTNAKPVIIVKDKNIAKKALAALKQLECTHPLAHSTIKITTALKLEKVKSLESLLARVPHGTIIFDPTATIERAKTLVQIAKAVRQQHHAIVSCFFASTERQLFFRVSANLRPHDIARMQREVEDIVLTHLQQLTKKITCTITVSPSLPRCAVIAIDNQSAVMARKERTQRLLSALFKKIQWSLLIAAGAASSLGITGARADDSCQDKTATKSTCFDAVSDLNLWLGAEYGGLHNPNQGGSGFAADGGFAFPFGHSFGGQFHGYYGHYLRHSSWSIDNYVFWRNATLGLLGSHITYTEAPSLYQTIYGVHGEAYINDWTLVAEAGGTHLDHFRSSGNGYYVEAIVHWYPLPDWELDAGVITERNATSGQIGTEYQFGLASLPGLSAYADIGAGSHHLLYGMIGIRLYFGGDAKALICRHRQDMIPPTLDLIMLGRKRTEVPPFLS